MAQTMKKEDFSISYKGRTRNSAVVSVVHHPSGFSFKGIAVLTGDDIGFGWPADEEDQEGCDRRIGMITFLEKEGAFEDDDILAAMAGVGEGGGDDSAYKFVSGLVKAIRKKEDKNGVENNGIVRRVRVRINKD